MRMELTDAKVLRVNFWENPREQWKATVGGWRERVAKEEQPQGIQCEESLNRRMADVYDELREKMAPAYSPVHTYSFGSEELIAARWR